MKYLYRVMWVKRGTNTPSTSKSYKFYKFVEAHSVTEAIQIAGYEWCIGVACNVPILEVRIDKELEDG